RHDLERKLLDRAVELDLVQPRGHPVGQVLPAAGVDPGPAGLDLGLDPRPGAAVRKRPGGAAEDAYSVLGEELAPPHRGFPSRKARRSRARSSSEICSSGSAPAVAAVSRS